MRRLVAALRRAARLRRSPRRLPRHPRRPPPLDARPPRRRVGRRRRPPRPPPRPADPRAAHPPGEGHLQHLHRPGAPRRDRLDVRRVPRARGAAAHRRAGARRRPPAWPPTLRGGRRRGGPRRLLRHARRPRARPGRRGRGRRPRATASTCVGSTPTTSASPSTRPPPTTSSRGSLAAFGVARSSADGRRPSPTPLGRTTEYLTHPVFSTHRSETEMLRYLRRLADMDIALDRSMIPLGSCTMKLNATTEMAAVTWPEFGQLHPFCPPEQAEGYRELITSLEAWLGRDHRLRPRVAPAQRRLAGRAGRAARHPRLPRVPRRAGPRRLPHPVARPTAPTPRRR